MASPSAFLIISFIFLVGCSLSDARGDPKTDYWKSKMKEEPMPEAMKDLVSQGSESLDSLSPKGSTTTNLPAFDKNSKYVERDFDETSYFITWREPNQTKPEDGGQELSTNIEWVF